MSTPDGTGAGAAWQPLLSFIEGDGAERWFRRDPEFDAAIRATLLPWHERAATGALDRWVAEAQSALVLLVLLDQVPRNLFRDSARAFTTDLYALSVAERAIMLGHPGRVAPPWRKFFYLPLEHAEDPALQERSCALMATTGQDDDLVWAEKHRDVIRRFGRFPHRNAALGRASTPAELAYLAEPGAGF